jgi:CheY-like chemotaxis protein
MSFCARRKQAVILVVEDDLGDQILIRQALEDVPVGKEILVASDGDEALEVLRNSGWQSGEATPLPDVILLDLNMPGMGGRELLAKLKSDPALKAVPVVIFTTSCRPADVTGCYAEGANSFVQKPSDFEQFQSVIRRLGSYWIQISTPWRI